MARKITGENEKGVKKTGSRLKADAQKKISSVASGQSGNISLLTSSGERKKRLPLSETDVLQAMINEANKRIEKERERQIAAEVISEQSGEPIKLKRGEWGRRALNFAEKEITRIYGEDADLFTLEGIDLEDTQKKQDLIDALNRVISSKMLTESGRREQAKIATANFFKKDPRDVTRREMNLLARLDDTGLLDKMKELNMQYSILFDALDLSSDFANRSDISLAKKIRFLEKLVNNKDGFQDKVTKNGVIDYYGALGEYFGSEDFRN